MYTYRGSSFAAGVVRNISDGTGCARGKIKIVTLVGYNLKEKKFMNYTINFWSERKVYGRTCDMTAVLARLNVKVGSRIIVKGIADQKNPAVLNADEIGYTGKKFHLENGFVGLIKVKGIYQTRNDEVIRMAVEMDGQSYNNKKLVWLTVKNSTNPLGFVIHFKDSVQKHINVEDTVMAVFSDIKQYNGKGGMYEGAYLNGFYVMPEK